MICPRCKTNAYLSDYCVACSYEKPEIIPEEIVQTLAADKRWGPRERLPRGFDPRPSKLKGDK